MISDLFGSMVFHDGVMQERLPHAIYCQLHETRKNGRRLDPAVADAVAHAMKDWAISKGATHFTHWFQPMTGRTAEKHDSFLSPAGDGGAILAFSGKELVQGEPDASSFPSGGLRATFEARGYTAWDPTSYAFIKDHVLCIPTAFCSYGGEALDKKTPLLRSMEAINRQALRVLTLFGNHQVTSVRTTAGPEQEYFLIDEAVYRQRNDLLYTGRTLLGATPPKGQELNDHYFGVIKPQVAAFMKDLDETLWTLGVYAKTEHNETAPAQHELAPVFTTANVAADHNQLTMELMQTVARRHGLVCLLHEKPFAGVNGSGKHINWSLSTDQGTNLLEPGKTPYENAQFLLFLCAVIQAVDDYQDLLRISVASPGNDRRLGANEAPPAILSIFLGDELTEILQAIDQETDYQGQAPQFMKIGVHTIPKFPKDTTDRNRTSPFAFTGNRFEFRMPGSSASISGPNTVLNTAVAESLRQYADQLEGAENFEAALHDLIRQVIHDHKRIIFNGNGYEEAWLAQAEARGLLNLPTLPDCSPYMLSEKNLRLYETHKIFTRAEQEARYEIRLKKYAMVLTIEARTMIDMVRRDILPAVSAFTHTLTKTAISKRDCGLACLYEENTAADLSALTDAAFRSLLVLENLLTQTHDLADPLRLAQQFRDHVIPAMDALRETVDQLECLVSQEAWPYPSYGALLFSIK